MKLHLGCGGIALPDFYNVDAEKTDATDLVHDCSDLSIFADNSSSLVFSHAFFEHLYRRQRLSVLKEVRRILFDDGCVLFCGLPDFEMIARAYLDKTAAGQVSSFFDLWEVYRCTHGNPEYHPDGSTAWMNQLHKSLFDVNEIKELCYAAKFRDPTIFRYRYKEEPNLINIGFAARKDGKSDEIPLWNLLSEVDVVVHASAVQICT